MPDFADRGRASVRMVALAGGFGEGFGEASLVAGGGERGHVPDLLGDDTRPSHSGSPEPSPHGQDESMEDRLGAPRLDPLEHGNVGQAGAVVQGEEDDPLPASHGGG